MDYLKYSYILSLLVIFTSCDTDNGINTTENPATFKAISSIDLGGNGAAEITAYDPVTYKLFITNNENSPKIDIVDITNPSNIKKQSSIDVAGYGASVNSVAVSQGKLAAAIEATDKQSNGKIVVFSTSDYSEIASIEVGALPDMVTFSPNGKLIVCANEGEPNQEYTIDPNGSISIIEVENGYAATTLDFSAFNDKESSLKDKGFRVYGPGATLAQDLEPEYIAISNDSKFAWATLQENNGVAKIDLATKSIQEIFPLGFKDFNKEENAIDVSDKDNKIDFKSWNVKGIFSPDAIAFYKIGGDSFIVTANEGDARKYSKYNEESRVMDIKLNPSVFSQDSIQAENQLGRLNITLTIGDRNSDGIYEGLYAFGARSFSIWNANTGVLINDSKNDIEKKVSSSTNLYDDGRSDDQGVEPEGVTIGQINGKYIAFVGLERADAVISYDITDPLNIKFLQILETGDAPEGILFIPASDSPSKKSLLVVSSEGDGTVKTYTPSM